MKNLWLLTKTQLKSIYSVDKAERKKANKLNAIIVLSFLPTLIMIAVGAFFTSKLTAEAGIHVEYLSTLMVLLQALLIFFCLASLFSTVYFSKDNELLLALPVSSTEIFLSKLACVYVLEFGVAALVGLFVFVPFGVGAGAGLLYYVLIPVAIVLLPVLPLLVSAVISVPLIYAVNYLKRKGAVASIVVFVIFTGVMILSFYFSMEMQNNTGEDIDFIAVFSNGIIAIAKIALPNTLLAGGMLSDKISGLLSFLGGIGTLAVLLIGTLFLVRLTYNKSLSSQLENPKAQNKNQIVYTGSKNVTVLLMKKDWSEIIKESGIALNCLIQLAMGPIMLIFFAMMMKNIGATEEIDFVLPQSIISGIFVGSMLFFVLGTNSASGTAISRESKNAYIMKIIPVPYDVQLKAKVYVGSLFSLVSLVLTAIVGFVLIDISIVYLLLGTIFLVLLAHAMSHFYVYLDLRKPKLEWKSANEFKNNSAMLLGMLVSFIGIISVSSILSVGIILELVLGWKFAPYAAWILLIGIATMLIFIFENVLYKNAENLMDKLVE